MESIEQMIKRLCPEGVEWKSFSEIGSYIRGITYNKAQENNTGDGDGWKVFRANNITLSSNSLNYDDVKVVQKSVKVKETQVLKKHDILICAGSGSKDHIGKVAYINKDMDYTFGGFMGVLRIDEKLALSRYLFHILTSKIFKDYLSETLNSSTINNLNTQIMNDFEIPLPPMEIQARIVEILDKMTTLTAELEAELEARKQQYEYYRNKLLTFDKLNEGKQINLYKMSEFVELKAGKAIKASELSNIRDSEHPYPCYGGNGIRGYIAKYSHEGKYAIIGRQGALCGCVNWAEGRFYATEHAMVCTPNNLADTRFLYFLFAKEGLNKYKSQGAQPGLSVSNLNNIVFAIPSMEEQSRIVSILDRFETLTTDLQSGLPAEIEARRQQYEHYRNKLLTFERQ